MRCKFCGKLTDKEFCSATCKMNRSRYSDGEVTRKYWIGQTFGKLKIDPKQSLPSRWVPSTTQKFVFNCLCGKTKLCAMNLVTKGDITTCGKCLEKSKEIWSKTNFGALSIDPEQDLPAFWKANTTLKFIFRCQCGGRTTQKMNTVSSGLVKSCGKCLWRGKEYWLQKKFGKLRIQDTSDLPLGWAKWSEIKVPVLCICGRTNDVTFYNLHKTNSCGSCSVGVSEESKKVGLALKKIFPDLQTEVRGLLPGRLRLDFYSKTHNLAIEYHGLIWHSEKTNSNRRRDFHKYIACKEKGIRLIQIYNDDWDDRRDIFLDLLRNLANPKEGRRVYKAKVQEIPCKEAKEFLDQNHYLSGRDVKGSLYVGLRTPSGELVAVSVFLRIPTGVDWIRHSVKLGVRLWNPASKCLDFAINKLKPAMVKSFSDNRLHTGKTYESLGFTNDGQTGLSYEYTDGLKRVHKFSKRQKRGVSEIEEAARQGWYRVFDSGKTRWVLNL